MHISVKVQAELKDLTSPADTAEVLCSYYCLFVVHLDIFLDIALFENFLLGGTLLSSSSSFSIKWDLAVIPGSVLVRMFAFSHERLFSPSKY